MSKFGNVNLEHVSFFFFYDHMLKMQNDKTEKFSNTFSMGELYDCTTALYDDGHYALQGFNSAWAQKIHDDSIFCTSYRGDLESGTNSSCAICQKLPEGIEFDLNDNDAVYYRFNDKDLDDGGSIIQCDAGDIATGLCVSTNTKKCRDPHNEHVIYGQILTCRTPKIAGDAYKLDDDDDFNKNWVDNSVNINARYNSLTYPSEDDGKNMTKVQQDQQKVDFSITIVDQNWDSSFSGCKDNAYVTGMCIQGRNTHACGDADERLWVQDTHSLVKCKNFYSPPPPPPPSPPPLKYLCVDEARCLPSNEPDAISGDECIATCNT